jgi:hypothetical protein
MNKRQIVLITVFSLLLASTGQSQLPSQSTQKDQLKRIVGTWEWNLSIGPLKNDVSMEVQEKDGKPLAIVTLPDGTKVEAKDFRINEDRVQFSVRHAPNSKTITLTHDGKLSDSKMIGTVKITGAPIETSSKWNASRKPLKPSFIQR